MRERFENLSAIFISHLLLIAAILYTAYLIAILILHQRIQDLSWATGALMIILFFLLLPVYRTCLRAGQFLRYFLRSDQRGWAWWSGIVMGVILLACTHTFIILSFSEPDTSSLISNSSISFLIALLPATWGIALFISVSYWLSITHMPSPSKRSLFE